MKYFILPLLLLIVFSCSPKHSDEYKILERGKGFVTIELNKRTTPENLFIYAEEVSKEIDDFNLFHISFMLPSEYPFNPNDAPWAFIMYSPDRSSSLHIYGTRSDKHKKNLLGLKFESDHQIGKWYYQVPINEKVIFIAELDGKLVISEFSVESVSQNSDASNSETKIKDMTQSEFKQWDQYIELERNPGNSNEFKIKGTEYWQYRIDKDNKLLFLDAEGKVYKEAIPVS